MRLRLLPLSLLALASAARAETVLSDVTGNWAAPQNDGFYYRAVLTDEGEMLRLRIYQGLTADGIETEPQLDNGGIAYASAKAGDGGRDWLEVGPNGELFLNSYVVNDSYVYTERLTIQLMDNQFTAMAFEQHNNGSVAAEAMPESPVGCFSGQCYSCEADLWNQSAVAGGEKIAVPAQDMEALNASSWTPGRAAELGYCPAAD